MALDIKTRLEKLGYGVLGMVSSGEEALQKAAQLQPDLVVMDIQLSSEMDGIQAAQEIRTRIITRDLHHGFCW